MFGTGFSPRHLGRRQVCLVGMECCLPRCCCLQLGPNGCWCNCPWPHCLPGAEPPAPRLRGFVPFQRPVLSEGGGEPQNGKGLHSPLAASSCRHLACLIRGPEARAGQVSAWLAFLLRGPAGAPQATGVPPLEQGRLLRVCLRAGLGGLLQGQHRTKEVGRRRERSKAGQDAG